MKKLGIISALLLCLALNSPNAQAVNTQMGGGFSGPGLAVSTVAKAKTLPDNSAVVLRGNIEKSLGNEKYLFKDSTGTITVEIDNDKWGGINATPADKIEINGEIEKEWGSVKVDVASVRKL